MTVSFFIPGPPTAKGRPRMTRTGHTYTPEKTRQYEKLVYLCWKEQSGQTFPPDTPLRLTAEFRFPIPQSLSKKKKAWLVGKPHIKKPDADNVLKAILDGCQPAVFPDDSAIATIHAKKLYSTDPGVYIRIEEL